MAVFLAYFPDPAMAICPARSLDQAMMTFPVRSPDQAMAVSLLCSPDQAMLFPRLRPGTTPHWKILSEAAFCNNALLGASSHATGRFEASA
jgi:hypothetical protein